MIWVPPPHWLLAMLVAFVVQLVVIAIVFMKRGWLRGVIALPVGLAIYIVSAIGGGVLDATFWQLDPVPLVTFLTGGVYATYALMMWRPRPQSGETRHAV